MVVSRALFMHINVSCHVSETATIQFQIIVFALDKAPEHRSVRVSIFSLMWQRVPSVVDFFGVRECVKGSDKAVECTTT